MKKQGGGDSVNSLFPDSETRKGRVGKGVAQTLQTSASQGVIVKALTETRTPEAKEIRKQSMKQGKDFSPRRGKTITAGGQSGMDKIPNIVLDNIGEWSIRRLTEIECERLQGFADNWTKFGMYPAKKISQKKFNELSNDEKIKIFEGAILIKKKISKTQRYKQTGNAVTKDIAELVVRKLKN